MKRNWSRSVVYAAGAAVLALGQARGSEYTLPTKWKGQANGQTDGNPLVVNGKPLWRADELTTENPTQPDAYQVLAWNSEQKRWRNVPSGGAVVPSMGSGIGLGASMTKQQPRRPGSGALVFIAPAAGKYTVTGKVTGRRWNQPPNQLAEKLVVLKADKAAQKISELTSLPLREEPSELNVEAELAAGDEIIFVQTGIRGGTGSNTLLSDLKITGP